MGSVNKVVISVEAASALYASGMSLPQIAAHLGASASTVRTRLIESGVKLRSPVEGMTKAKREGRGVSPLSGRYRRTPETIERLSASRRLWGEENASGYRVTSNGYIELTRGPQKGRALHAVIMEAMIGRPLRANEVVHHRDENRTNNSPGNLALMTRSSHAAHHRREGRKDVVGQ